VERDLFQLLLSFALETAPSKKLSLNYNSLD
jgi:hypothetical protein